MDRTLAAQIWWRRPEDRDSPRLNRVVATSAARNGWAAASRVQLSSDHRSNKRKNRRYPNARRRSSSITHGTRQPRAGAAVLAPCLTEDGCDMQMQRAIGGGDTCWVWARSFDKQLEVRAAALRRATPARHAAKAAFQGWGWPNTDRVVDRWIGFVRPSRRAGSSAGTGPTGSSRRE